MRCTRAGAAVEEGILPGGGVSVIRAARKTLDSVAKKTASEDQKLGVEIVRRAVEAPIKQIAENARRGRQRDCPEGEGDQRGQLRLQTR